MANVSLTIVRGGLSGELGDQPLDGDAAQVGRTDAQSGDKAEAGSNRIRIVDAALRCFAVHGIAKTALDDIAAEARCSRATIYRVFPGGKDALIKAVAQTEVARLFSAVAVAMGEADDLEDVLVAGMMTAARWLSAHEALAYLSEHEPDLVLPHLTFDHMDALLEKAAAFAAPFMGRWLAPEHAQRVAEHGARIVLSYLASPSEDVDLTDASDVRRLVRTFVLPAVRAMAATTASFDSPENKAIRRGRILQRGDLEADDVGPGDVGLVDLDATTMKGERA